jgi:hypothetical protein
MQIIRPITGITPSPNYRAWLPGIQAAGTGAVLDRSGKSANGVIVGGSADTALTDGEVWANAGWFSSVAVAAATPKVIVMDRTRMQVDGVTQSFLFSIQVQKAAPAASEAIVGFGSTTGGTGSAGWYLSARATNSKVRLIAYDGTTLFNPADSTLNPFDNTPHTLAVAFDAVTKQAFVWMDGVLSDGPLATGITGSLIPTGAGFNFWVGGVSLVPNTSGVGRWRDLHYLAFNGGLPTQITNLVRIINQRPFVPLSAAETA